MQTNKTSILSQIQGGLIVSCQALEDEPLHSPMIMARMARAAMMGGASGIRANSVDDIKAIREEVKAPIIGIIKQVYADSDVYITPTLDEIGKVVDAGADIIATDATNRMRTGGLTLDHFMEQVRKKYPDILMMADCSTLPEALHAESIGFDFAGTTMRSYTAYTKGIAIPDFGLFKALEEQLHIPFIAEGGIWVPEQVQHALDCGAFAVVVGSAITRPQLITKYFVSAMRKRPTTV